MKRWASLPNYPFLNITEYGKGEGFHDRLRSTGVSEHELGLFIDSRLKKEAANIAATTNPLSRLLELNNLKLRDSLLQCSSIEKYSKHTKLYFGYAHKLTSHKHFIRSVAHLAKNGKENIDMVLVLDDTEALPSIFDKELQEELLAQGIGAVSIISADSGQTVDIELLNDPSKSRLRIFVNKKLEHSDMENLLLMSQPLTMITGDQSLSEAIACGKHFMYECYVHKVGLNDSLLELASKHSLESVHNYLIDTTTPENNFATFGSWGKRFKWNLTSQDYDQIIERYSNGRFQGEWKTFIAILHKQHSLDAKVVPLVKKLLAQNLCLRLQQEEAQLREKALVFLKDST